jgi:hypothetical protein
VFTRALGFAERDPFDTLQVNAMFVQYSDGFSTGAAFTGNLHAKTTESTEIGNWLVRDSVPEPSALLIFAAGLIALGYTRRKF